MVDDSASPSVPVGVVVFVVDDVDGCERRGICSTSLLRIPRCTDDLTAVLDATSSERENLLRSGRDMKRC